MKILNHKLILDSEQACPFQATPNVSKNRTLKPEYIVIHYTSGVSSSSSINWLCNPNAKASAHIVIGRDGQITQLAPFNRVTWHAGISRWNQIQNLNGHSIGIELDNAGLLHKQGEQWKTWSGQTVPEKEVFVAAHKNDASEIQQGWHAYTPEQIEACLELCHTLIDKYHCLEVLGHEDIAPERKTDPGPAFPMAHLQASVDGRMDQPEQPTLFKTTTRLNIRSGPGTHFAKLEEGPLPEGTRVQVRQRQQGWHFVELEEPLNQNADIEGWVFARYLEPV